MYFVMTRLQQTNNKIQIIDKTVSFMLYSAEGTSTWFDGSSPVLKNYHIDREGRQTHTHVT